MKEPTIIISKTYELNKELIPVLRKFPRDQRFLLGNRIQTLAGDLLEDFIEAHLVPRDKKRRILIRQNIRLEKIRLFIRMGYELGHYTSKKYQYFAELLLELGRMTGGWIRSLQ
jgi:hypothetical protein